MKLTVITLFLILFVTIGCKEKTTSQNNFTSEQDTLILKTVKVKGHGMFPAGAGQVYFRDTTERYDYPVTFPKNIKEIKLSWRHVDSKPFQFENLKESKSDYLITFLNNNFPKKFDTLNIPSIRDNSICVMSGQLGNDTIFIIDENNNKDFRDDSVRLYREMDWHTMDKLIKCKYNIYNGSELVEDSSWVNIGTSGDNELLWFVSNRLKSTFSIDNRQYQIGIVDNQSNFGFDDPILALLSVNGINKDTLLDAELLNKGEYLKLQDDYYCIDNVSNDGKYLTLIKEKDFNSKIGTQLGMLAPDFKCKSINGDSIQFKDYNGGYLLLANVSSCWSKVSSYKCFKDLSEAYNDKLEIICLDKSPVTLGNNIKELKLTGKFINVNENKMLEAYRPEFCSRTCFLIDQKGRIIDKFEIFDWEISMQKHFD